MQQTFFSEELNYLSLDGDTQARRTPPSLVHNLNLFFDADGLVRSAGRVDSNQLLSYDAKNKILTDETSSITTLLLRDAHHQNGHMGLNYTANFLRQTGLWITRISQAVSIVLKGCFVCKGLNAKPFKTRDPLSLPSARVNFSRPFAVADVGFTGHFFVLDPFGNRQKIYLLIFTCFSSRAIYLETLSSMAVNDFLLALVRFSNEFGMPDKLHSDNVKTFLSGASVLSNLIPSSEFERRFRSFNIE